MAEYIEREALLEKVKELSNTYSITGLASVHIIKAIEDAPKVDVVEVKHGEWITPTKIRSMTIPVPHCSLCGNVPCDKVLYCPYCGAKMDLEEGAEE